VALRGDDGAHPHARPHVEHDAGDVATTSPRHEQVDDADAGATETVQHAAGVGGAVEHQHRTARPPQVGAAGELDVGGQRRRPRREHEGERTGGDREPAPSVEGDDHAGGEDERLRVGRAQRQRGAAARHEGDPPDHDVGRHVEERGDVAAHDAGDEAGGEAPRCERSRHGDGEHVGHHRHHRHVAERQQQERRHPDLGRQRHAERLGQPRRARDPVGQPPGEQHEAGRRAHRQLEPDAPRQQGVDHQQRGHGQRQDPQPRRGSTRERRPARQRSHRRGAQDGRLRPRHHREQRDHRERRDQA
jgi:hypothetical protein